MTKSSVRALTFRTKIALGMGAIALFAAVIVATALVSIQEVNRRNRLHRRTSMYAALVAQQMQPVVAFNDRLTARDIFASMRADDELEGIAIYADTGSLIEGIGVYPPTLHAGETPPKKPGGRVVAMLEVASPEGPHGQLYVSLSKRKIEHERANGIWAAAGVAVAALIGAFFFALALSRAFTRGLEQIAGAADRVAAGLFDEPIRDAGGGDDEISRLASAFNSMLAELRQLFGERRKAAEQEQSRLYELVRARTYELEESREQYRLVAETINVVPFTYLPGEGRFGYVGPQAKRLGYSLTEWRVPGFLATQLMTEDSAGRMLAQFAAAGSGNELELEITVKCKSGDAMQLRWVVAISDSNGVGCLRGIMLDVTEQRRLESELAQAQKLESVGRLAAGVAHEINTPIQFVSDSVHFVQEAMTDLEGVLDQYHVLQNALDGGGETATAAHAVREAEQEADLPYLKEHIPKALERALDGLGRVATIVRSMKEFAHPDQKEKTYADLNKAIQSTLVVARNEYKYVAEIETDFADLPPVLCHVSEINQVVLNLVVNAAHAIADRHAGTTDKGTITVKTRRDGDDVVITLTDTGNGIPEAVRDRIFDPFFTTKAVGRGTGQGLAIARTVVVDKHLGALRFETTEGIGTSFFVRLPIGDTTIAAVAEIAA